MTPFGSHPAAQRRFQDFTPLPGQARFGGLPGYSERHSTTIQDAICGGISETGLSAGGGERSSVGRSQDARRKFAPTKEESMTSEPERAENKVEKLILQHVAHSSGEDTDSRDGWCRWGTSDRWPWDWDDYRPLVGRGLLERKETWKDVLLRLTPAGWEALRV